jgi:hypothetical protein
MRAIDAWRIFSTVTSRLNAVRDAIAAHRDRLLGGM